MFRYFSINDFFISFIFPLISGIILLILGILIEILKEYNKKNFTKLDIWCILIKSPWRRMYFLLQFLYYCALKSVFHWLFEFLKRPIYGHSKTSFFSTMPFLITFVGTLLSIIDVINIIQVFLLL